MTKEELKEHCERQIKMCEEWAKGNGREPSGKTYEEHKLILELLEQPTSDDCVSRAEVIDELNRLGRNAFKDDTDYDNFFAFVDSLPPVTPTQSWIPVSEDLPKENGWYQCTVILNDLPWTMELFYKNGKWLDNRRINMFDTYDIYGYGNTKEKHKLSYQELISEFEWNQVVIAWQPLPKPYEEKRGDSNGSN